MGETDGGSVPLNGTRAQLGGLEICQGAAGKTEMAGAKESVLERFAVQAIAGGAKTMKIEYDEGYEEVYACQGGVGVSIGCRIPSSSEEVKSLRAELYAMRKRPVVLTSTVAPMSCAAEHTTVLAKMRLK